MAEKSGYATGVDDNREEISIKTNPSAEYETLEAEKSPSSSRDGTDKMIPEIRVQHWWATGYKKPNTFDVQPVDMCSTLATKTAIKISNSSVVTRRISEESAPDGSKLKPAERIERRRKRSFSLDPQILLQWAATHNDVETLKNLLETTNVDVNEPGVDGFYPLHRAASTGSLECLQYLVTKGAQLEVRDKDGSSPLDAAVSEGEFDCARFLIEKGANINHIRDGFTDKDLVRVGRRNRGMTSIW